MGNEFQNRCLKHHGIKGQKWGVRRFQNADGSLTTAGIARYRKGTKNKMNDTQGSVLAAVGTVAITASAIRLTVTAVKNHNLKKRIKRMAEDAATNSNAKKYEQEREGETVDPESGLYKKNKKMTEQEDMDRVNPNFDSDNDFFKVNCTACTVAMDIRQRGFDVHAGTDGENMLSGGGSNAFVRMSWYKDGGKEYSRRYNNNGIYFDDESTSDSRLKAVEAQTSKTPNSRGEMAVSWLGGGGHSMYYKTDKKGKLTVFDAQTNTTYSGDSLKKLLDNAETVTPVRLDDMEYNYDMLKKTNIIV